MTYHAAHNFRLWIFIWTIFVGYTMGDTAAAQVTVIEAGILIDGTGSPSLNDHYLVIEDTRIVGVFADGSYDVPEDATVIDASGLTVLPGLINAHTHFTKDFSERRDNHLAHGVTSICNLGAGYVQMPEFDVYMQDGQYAARGFKAGPFVAKEGGYAEVNWGQGANYNITGTDEAVAAVNDLAAQGADYIKISFEPGPGGWPILSFEEARTVTDAAHERGLQVIAHVEDASYLDQAIDSGVDIITHIGYRWQGERLFTDMSNLTPDSTPFSNYDGYDALITRMVEHVALIPTLDVLIGERALDSAPAVGMTEVVRRFHERGGLVAVGDDYPLGVTQPGIPFGEIEHLLAAGLTPLEVITAGTKNAALVCGHGDDLGTLEAGKLADLIIVEGDPLEDLEALRNLKLVMIDGQIAFDYR